MSQERLIRFLSLWILNSVVLNLATLVLKGSIVLGTDKVSKSMAAVFAGLALTALSWVIPKIVNRLDFKIKSDYMWQVLFFVGNFLLLWVIKRFALTTGLGISNNLYVLLMAAVITAVQWKTLGTLAFLMPKK